MSRNQFKDDFMETLGSGKEDEQFSSLQKANLKAEELILDYNKETFQEILKLNKDRPVNLINVNIHEGSKPQNFRDSFLKRQLQPMLKTQETTLQELFKNIDLTTENLLKCNAIDNAVVHLDALPGLRGDRDTLNIVANMNVVPVKRFFMKIGTNVGNGEGDGYITFQWKNIFGGGEMVNLDTTLASNELGKSNRSQYLMSFSSPLLNSPNYRFDLLGYHSSKFVDFTTYHEQLIRGVTMRLTNQKTKNLQYELSLENLLRSINIANPPNSYRNNSIINDFFLLNAGTSLKSSLTHSIQYDTRDNLTLPSKGEYFKQSLEVGLLPQNQFAKYAVQLSKSTKYKSLIFHANFKSGLIKSLNGSNIHPMDKFHLGGANDVRGFLISGLGPKQLGLSCGGDLFYSFNTSIISDVPYFSDSNFKFHLFNNSGKLTNFVKEESSVQLFNRLKQTSTSCGVGVIYAHPMARFELNWVIPLTINSGDDYKHGLQWGIGISFM